MCSIAKATYPKKTEKIPQTSFYFIVSHGFGGCVFNFPNFEHLVYI